MRIARANRSFLPWKWTLVLLLALFVGRVVGQERILYHYAIENLASGQIVRQGKMTDAGLPPNDVFLAPNSRYRAWILRVDTLQIGQAEFTTPDAGSPFTMPQIRVGLSRTPDLDGDGLSTEAEFIVGTNPLVADSNGDGIKDGAAIRLGIEAGGVRTGIIGSVASAGNALDVTAFNDVVVVADGAFGVSVYNVFNRMIPLQMAQVDTPGTALRVSGALNWVAAADGEAGLALIDISKPEAASIKYQLTLGAAVKSVAAIGTYCFAGLENGAVVAVDMPLGAILDRVTFGEPIMDLAIEGDRLYALTPSRLIAFLIEDGTLDGRSSIGVSFSPEGITGSRRLFVGGNIAYVTGYPGYDTIDVSNPGSMRIIGSAVDRGPNSFKQIVANGSGDGIATVGTNPRDDGTHDVYIFNVLDPAVTTALQTQFPTPGIARSVAIYNGLAYVADSQSGLQVINYKPVDALGRPPTIVLHSTALDGKVEEGKHFRVWAEVSDDVQVRNVEFSVDRRTVVTDGNFPFEQRLLTPLRSATKNSIVVRARATDTGGNATWSDELTLTLAPDATPPIVRRTLPDQGAIVGATRLVGAYFSEPVAQFDSRSVKLRGLGADGISGTADDFEVSGGTYEYRADVNAGFITFGSDLAPGQYVGEIGPPLTDLTGNAVRPFQWRFWILGGADADQDGIPDAIELALGTDQGNPDSDGDGVLDGDEDFDNDGLPNRWEILYEFDPSKRDANSDNVADADEDPDFDTLPTIHEFRNGTNPYKADTDGDGWDDATEISEKSDPLSPSSGARVIVSSIGASYLNQAELQIPVDVAVSVGSSQVTFLNGQVEEPPITIPVLVGTPLVTYLNQSIDAPPRDVPTLYVSGQVSFLNQMIQLPPVEISVLALSSQASYLNQWSEPPPMTIPVQMFAGSVSYLNQQIVAPPSEVPQVLLTAPVTYLNSLVLSPPSLLEFRSDIVNYRNQPPTVNFKSSEPQ